MAKTCSCSAQEATSLQQDLLLLSSAQPKCTLLVAHGPTSLCSFPSKRKGSSDFMALFFPSLGLKGKVTQRNRHICLSAPCLGRSLAYNKKRELYVCLLSLCLRQNTRRACERKHISARARRTPKHDVNQHMSLSTSPLFKEIYLKDMFLFCSKD